MKNFRGSSENNSLSAKIKSAEFSAVKLKIKFQFFNPNMKKNSNLTPNLNIYFKFGANSNSTEIDRIRSDGNHNAEPDEPFSSSRPDRTIHDSAEHDGQNASEQNPQREYESKHAF